MRRFSTAAILFLAGCTLSHAGARPQESAPKQTPYTIVDPSGRFTEEKDPQKRIVMLDDFSARHLHAEEAVLRSIYPLYLQAYGELKNYPKVMEYADKLAALHETRPEAKFNATYAWIASYNQLNSGDPLLAASVGPHVDEARKALAAMQKPQNVDDVEWGRQKTKFSQSFQAVLDKAEIASKNSRKKPNLK